MCELAVLPSQEYIDAHYKKKLKRYLLSEFI